MSRPAVIIKEKSWLARIAAAKLGSPSAAIVWGNTIHLHGITRAAFLDNKRLVKHEYCHVRQFKQYGFLPFVVKYLWESIKSGYYRNKYEVEARAAEVL